LAADSLGGGVFVPCRTHAPREYSVYINLSSMLVSWLMRRSE